MHILAQIAVAIVALTHVGFLVLEMFLWDKPVGMRIFNTNAEQAAQTKVLAANQGLYNGFLAAGLIWSLLPVGLMGNAKPVAIFFLLCVIVAGVFGALTVSKRILRVQALPAAVALALVWFLAA